LSADNITFLVAVFSGDAGSFLFPLADKRHIWHVNWNKSFVS